MATICPSCDHTPDPAAAIGSACAICGTLLISLGTVVDPAIGTVIDGRFEILDRLGAGGMGTVYRARQKSIGRDVALKLIDRKYDREVAAVKRFFREAQLASKLAHPNTIAIIDFGQHEDGRPYLAMELVVGRSLDAVLRAEGAFTLERVVRIGVQICDALAAAHALQIIHRDLKLDNVMLLDGEGDHIKVLDFGLARSLVDPESRATATGVVSGTPRFMPPEVGLQAAEPAQHHDTYALGVILAELAINEALWTAPSVPAMFAAKLTPDVSRVPLALRPLVARLISATPADRPTAREARALLLALDACPAAPAVEPALTVDSMPIGPIQPIAAPTSSAFAPPGPPGTPSTNEPELALEPEWQKAREAKQAAAAAPPRPPKRRVGAIVAAVVVAAACASGIYYATRKSDAQMFDNTRMVAITITSHTPVEVKIDGRGAGKTPLTFHVTKSSVKHMLSATIDGVAVARELVADANKLIDLSEPPR